MGQLLDQIVCSKSTKLNWLSSKNLISLKKVFNSLEEHVEMIGGNYSYSSGGRGLSFGAVIEEVANGYNNQLLNGHNNSNSTSASRSSEHVVRRPSVDEYLSSEGFSMYDYIQRKQIKDSNDLKRHNHEANLYCACDRHLRRRLTSSES